LTSLQVQDALVAYRRRHRIGLRLLHALRVISIAIYANILKPGFLLLLTKLEGNGSGEGGGDSFWFRCPGANCDFGHNVLMRGMGRDVPDAIKEMVLVRKPGVAEAWDRAEMITDLRVVLTKSA
jgi:hypothetical protein